ncbi:hypothetical protein SDC9_129984 [bioreactor metagenome]|uniref:Uncharacterized protein n=1 Tax=bioreactor metagenome TaxID=1076179 RepID=A0A645D2F9_9ZZZZ
MVLGQDDVEIQPLVGAVLAHDLQVGGARGDGHGLALQIGVVLHMRTLFHQQARAGVEVVDGERHFLAARGVVGGGAALQIDGAVGEQRNAVLRRHGLPVHLQVGPVHGLLHGLGDGCGHLHGDTHALAAVQIAEGHGRFAIRERDGATVAHLGQGVRMRGTHACKTHCRAKKTGSKCHVTPWS